jgi:hypothetical protein
MNGSEEERWTASAIPLAVTRPGKSSKMTGNLSRDPNPAATAFLREVEVPIQLGKNKWNEDIYFLNHSFAVSVVVLLG